MAEKHRTGVGITISDLKEAARNQAAVIEQFGALISWSNRFDRDNPR
jgi:hypothetical protein